MAGPAVRADAFLHEVPDVIDALCQSATLADVTGDRWRRDASIETAAHLIGENGGVRPGDPQNS